MSRSARPVGALVLVLAATLTLNLAVEPAWADDYPTWADVEAAKQNEATKKAEITRIESLIAGLENEAALFAKAALEANEAYNQALDSLAAAESEEAALDKRADAAADKADESATQAGTLVSQLARTGGTDFTLELLLADETSADDLLYKIGAMDKLSTRSALIYEQAVVDLNLASALSGQASAATQARVNLAAEAEQALAEAQQAAADAEERAQNQEKAASQLYAQLASLKGTTASTEQAYLDGVAWEKAQAAITNPPPPPPPVNPPPPAPNTDAVAGAISFAQAQVGDAYVLNGSGPDAWDCSGLTKASYASVGVYVGTHSATNQYATMAAAGRLVPFNDLVAGDLLFYSSGGATSGTKYHVALYIGAGKMIEAPYPGVAVRVANVRYGDLVPYAGRPTP
jgi:cell wall-associated NlpC family hydrolase